MRLVVLPGDIRGWKAVLLTTGSLAYVISDAVQVYPQEYEIKPLAASRTGMPLASRGGSRRSAAANGSIEEQVASHSQDFLGTPYRWGGNDLVNGIDCSGLVKKLYGEVGVSLPRTAAEQSMVGEPITRLENLRAGDRLYFWDGRKGKVGHTGIYVGGGYFVHASNGHHQVVREPLGQAKWLRILVGARR
jgi:cell wall-associated NlpC family hydrolase